MLSTLLGVSRNTHDMVTGNGNNSTTNSSGESNPFRTPANPRVRDATEFQWRLCSTIRIAGWANLQEVRNGEISYLKCQRRISSIVRILKMLILWRQLQLRGILASEDLTSTNFHTKLILSMDIGISFQQHLIYILICTQFIRAKILDFLTLRRLRQNRLP